jgi:hypothetical protein
MEFLSSSETKGKIDIYFSIYKQTIIAKGTDSLKFPIVVLIEKGFGLQRKVCFL